MNKRIFITLLSAIAAICVSLAAHVPQDDGAQADLRQNPVMDTPDYPPVEQANYPAYIRLAANSIDMNGADWSSLRELFEASRDTAVSIVHIGDSHLQADMATAVTRRRMQQLYGSSGRGLIIPFKLAGTNEPSDYAVTTVSGVVSSRLLRMPWPTDMCFTGVGIQPVDDDYSLNIRSGEFFDSLVIYSSVPGVSVKAVGGDGHKYGFVSTSEGKRTCVGIDTAVTEVRVDIHAPANAAIGGISLISGSHGIAYHVIGNNGATYSTYSLIGSMGADVAALAPDLLVISLGTNEAFGRISDTAFRQSVDDLVGELRRANPSARLLLVTPAECQRRTSRRVRRKGRRRRYRTVSSYAVNTNVKRMRDVIVAYGRDNSIPVYDWYEVAGGTGSSAKWLADKTLNKDRVHLTYKGYQLQGNLFADALLKAIQQPSLQIE